MFFVPLPLFDWTLKPVFIFNEFELAKLEKVDEDPGAAKEPGWPKLENPLFEPDAVVEPKSQLSDINKG